MKTSVKILVVGFGLIANAAIAQAQVRDAGSKILGHYDHFDQPAQSQYSRGYSIAPAPIAQPMPATSAQRAFSYDPPSAAAPCVTQQTGPSAQASTQAAPQSTRRFSYDPSATGGTVRSYAPSIRARGWQGGVRDAGSKAMGAY
ncbi:MAG TPA: hypothetical protein VL175_10575 [Pirellulales bacterium]|jgi:hypothetical protein|nr:hypothetical protein [Pirellulales bacterium]